MPRFGRRSWREFDSGLPLTVRDVMHRWRGRLVSSAPWSAMPRDDVDGQIARVVAEVIDVSVFSNDAARRRRLVVAGALHGAFRRRQTPKRGLIHAEFAHVGDALEETFLDAGFSDQRIEDLLNWLRPDLEQARIAAEEGFNAGPTIERVLK